MSDQANEINETEPTPTAALADDFVVNHLKMTGNNDLSTELQNISDQIDHVLVSKTKKNKNQVEPPVVINNTPAVDVKSLSDAQLIQFLQQQELLKYQEKEIKRALKGKDVAKEHKFWNTQPMPQLTDVITEGNGPIDDQKNVSDVRQDPYNMPTGFSWCSLDMNDAVQAKEVYDLLYENYVEDDDCMFRFDYSVNFLQWALTPPGYIQDWHVGVRNIKTGALMGCITAIPVDINIIDIITPMAEINFLCVHKKLRTKRLAPVLIKEITRRVNLLNRWQAVYTAGVVLPKPIARCRYNHRTLNAKKLVEVKFTVVPQKSTLANMIKDLKLPAHPVNKKLRPMTPQDVPGVHRLINDYLKEKTSLYQVFNEHEIAHILLPRTGVVNTYVIESANGAITDVGSFYHLPSSVIGHEKHKTLNAVYSYYNVATSIPLVDLMRDMLILARNEDSDVFNALDLMENKSFLSDLKFGMGDGHLQYYVYNWRSPEMYPSSIGLVLL
eukprot:gene4696-6594_t